MNTVIGGIFAGSVPLLQYLALKHGPAGPVAALTTVDTVILTILDFSVFEHAPTAVKLAGVGVQILGVVALSLLPHYALPKKGVVEPGDSRTEEFCEIQVMGTDLSIIMCEGASDGNGCKSEL